MIMIFKIHDSMYNDVRNPKIRTHTCHVKTDTEEK